MGVAKVVNAKRTEPVLRLWTAMAFVDLCHLCGTDTLNKVRNAIFEGEGRRMKYALKISDCLSLQVSHRISNSSLADQARRFGFC